MPLFHHQAPHRLLATSAEFCVGALQDGRDCESVQFISGLTWSRGASGGGGGDDDDELLLSFGVNDCESRLGQLELARVWEMLAPLPCAVPPCGVCEEV